MLPILSPLSWLWFVLSHTCLRPGGNLVLLTMFILLLGVSSLLRDTQQGQGASVSSKCVPPKWVDRAAWKYLMGERRQSPLSELGHPAFPGLEVLWEEDNSP